MRVGLPAQRLREANPGAQLQPAAFDRQQVLANAQRERLGDSYSYSVSARARKALKTGLVITSSTSLGSADCHGPCVRGRGCP